MGGKIEGGKGRMINYTGILIALTALLAGNLRAADPWKYAEPGYKVTLPRDHGSHPDYRIEWWYLTGHLWTENKERRFGFQATWFRVGVDKKNRTLTHPTDAFGEDELFLAHMALVDIQTGRFIHEERFQRNNWDAWAKEEDLDLRNGNWTLKRQPGPPEQIQLSGSVLGDGRFSFRLKPIKPLVQFGEEGISRKGDARSAASIYLTFPRLELTGNLDWEGARHEVHGQAWMDHEISSSQLDQNQVGWDWASIQLQDGREIMVYLMRRSDGSFDPWSRLHWIDRDSKTTSIKPSNFSWTAKGKWKSPETGTEYPAGLVLKIDDPERKREITLHLNPLVQGQEMIGRLGGINYWEGACDVLDDSGRSVGSAYVELTGYDGKLEGRLR